MRVITYTDPRQLSSHPAWPLIRSTPHLCATISLAGGMERGYGSQIQGPIIALNSLFKTMLPRWSSKLAQVHQYGLLTGIIDGLKHRQEWAERLRAFRRNQRELLEGIRTLAEGGLRPSQLAGETEDERILQEVWTQLERKDDTLTYLRSELYDRYNDKAAFTEPLQAAIGVAGEIQRLVLHGFYFITPLQSRMIELMQRHDIDVIFLNCYDGDYPDLFACWEAFFPRDKFRWDAPPPSSASHSQAAQRFASLYQAQHRPQFVGEPPDTRILKYEDLAAFLEHVHQRMPPEGARERRSLPYFSPEATALNEILREYYPDCYERRHFLSYPVGQFLYQIHRMWDEEDDTLKLTGESLMECFSSGLLRTQVSGQMVNGRSHTRTLRKVLPFFKGCSELPEWKQRAEQLEALLTETVEPLDAQYSAEPRMHFTHILTNPLRRLSQFRVTPREVSELVILIKHLLRIAQELFGALEVPIATHMEKLAVILGEGLGEEELLEEEQELVHKLQAELSPANADRTPLPIKDLVPALQYYFSGITDEDDDELVKRFDQLDGAPLQYPGQPLHLCILHERALPAHRNAIPWPLTANSFAKVPAHRVTRMLRLREETAAAASLYLFYYALAFCGEVTLSWIAEWQNGKVAESAYLLVLRSCGVRQDSCRYQPWSEDEHIHRRPAFAVLPPEATAVFPDHAVAEYATCPRRFYYSYLASFGPAFESDYHQDFLYGRLVSWYTVKLGDPEAAATEVSRLFPQLSDTRKRDLTERWGDPFDGHDWYDNKRFSIAIRHLMIPGGADAGSGHRLLLRKGAAELAAVRAGMFAEQAAEQMDAVPGRWCRYCPHVDYCRDAQLPVDEDTGADS